MNHIPDYTVVNTPLYVFNYLHNDEYKLSENVPVCLLDIIILPKCSLGVKYSLKMVWDCKM